MDVGTQAMTAPEPAAFNMAELRRLWEAAPKQTWNCIEGEPGEFWVSRDGRTFLAKASTPEIAVLAAALHNAFPAIDAEMTRLRERVAELEDDVSDEGRSWKDEALLGLERSASYEARLSQLRAVASADKAKSGDESFDNWLSNVIEMARDQRDDGSFELTVSEVIGNAKVGGTPFATPTPAGARVAGEDVRAFAQAILHGDQEHRDWLVEAAEAWIADSPLPPPRHAATAPDPAAIRREALLEAATVRKSIVIADYGEDWDRGRDAGMDAYEAAVRALADKEIV